MRLNHRRDSDTTLSKSLYLSISESYNMLMFYTSRYIKSIGMGFRARNGIKTETNEPGCTVNE